ncbi:hypothetical protein DWV00_28335 [Trinickia dinghuensis]|uniref:Immunity protein 52 domain-containing protein n=2 Tax=Trinickia dinghuensis TaxID=2291023 RepID=A0A3D8JQU8_9BURK|nr:hypothetical protein DWV00_28335 [Trinickia dinghuensis]
MQITLIFQLPLKATLPSQEKHLGDLWRVAKLFEPLGFPIEKWYPSASTPKISLANPAFDQSGPTPIALAMLRAKDEKDKTIDYRITAVWNGATKGRCAAFSSSLSSDVDLPRCVFNLQFERVAELDDSKTMQQFVHGLVDIWPTASQIRVGPLRYYTAHKVFAKRPGAGWMLYLATAITAVELPEAAELVPVTEGDKQKGTIIISVADELFTVDNPEHVKIANAIEVRLADQDLLPR